MAQQQMTVEQLINELSKLPPDAVVFTEGCDCIGEAISVSYDSSDNSIMIHRS